MRVILIRHGETDGNRHRYIGRENLPLNDAGRQQAAALAQELSSLPISHIFCSPLLRALETAAPLAAVHGLTIQTRDALAEIDFGELTGMAKADQKRSIRRQHLTSPLPGGESIADVWRRLQSLTSELRQAAHGDAMPAVVGHYWSNRVLADLLRGVPFASVLSENMYKPKNGAAAILEIVEEQTGLGGRTTTKLNDL